VGSLPAGTSPWVASLLVPHRVNLIPAVISPC